MGRKMLINVIHPEEARVAIVQEGRLMELNIEISGREQTRGNIYKGVVSKVEPGLQAAFVDIGQKKPGFIQFGDIHPDSWRWRDDIQENDRKKRPRIQEILRRGQELIVQVEKDARDMKGAALTGYLSLPGRYMVLMPGDKAAGISRKIEDVATRKELKSLMAELQVPDGYGYIIRTEAVGRSIDEIRKDLDYLVGLHERIRQQGETLNGSGLIYQDSGLILRTLRDYFSEDIDEILVDDKAACQQAIDYFVEFLPGYEKRVKLHREKRPIFSKYQLEEQIDQLYEKRVPLPSGGSLVIEPTEALVSIDVNSGKSSGEKGIEDTAYKTNLEAAAEVARQLRLRDLGGLVVIDFIDMRDSKHIKEVEQTLKEMLKIDKARVNLGHISQFGMLEMSRQRIAKNINDAIHLECPHCEGRGRVKSVEAMALSFLRKVHAAAAKGQLSEVRGGLPLEVAYYLLNRKKRELAQIENDYEIVVTVKGKPSFLLNQLELELIRKEKPSKEGLPQPEVTLQQEQGETDTVPDLAQQTPVAAEKELKKKRRRKKKKPAADKTAELSEGVSTSEQETQIQIEQPTEPAPSVSENSVQMINDSDEPMAERVEAITEEVSAKVAKKRKTSAGSRKKKVAEVVQATAADVDSDQAGDAESKLPEKSATRGGRARKVNQELKPEQVDGMAQQAATEEPVKQTRSRRSSTAKKKVAAEKIEVVPANQPELEVEVLKESDGEEVKKRSKIARKTTKKSTGSAKGKVQSDQPEEE